MVKYKNGNKPKKKGGPKFKNKKNTKKCKKKKIKIYNDNDYEYYEVINLIEQKYFIIDNVNFNNGSKYKIEKSEIEQYFKIYEKNNFYFTILKN